MFPETNHSYKNRGVAMKIYPIIALTLLLSVLTLYGQELTGKQIMEKALNKTSWQDMEADVKLILTNSRGEQRVRQIKMYSRKRTADESDMLMRFIAPPDVKGTGFLIIEHKNSDDDRYLYLPALRRVKRIASSGKGGNFMSSDFTYYDIGKPKLNDWTYRRLPDETLDGHPCYVIECLPASDKVAKETGYGKIIRWIRQDVWVTVKSEYYDRALRLWKVLTVPKIEKIGSIWFQTDMIMKDVQNKHTSEMVFSNIRINRNIPAAFFTQRYLQRGR